MKRRRVCGDVRWLQTTVVQLPALRRHTATLSSSIKAEPPSILDSGLANGSKVPLLDAVSSSASQSPLKVNLPNTNPSAALTPMEMVALRVKQTTLHRKLARRTAPTPASIASLLGVYRTITRPPISMTLSILRALCPPGQPERGDTKAAMSIYQDLIARSPPGTLLDEGIFAIVLRPLLAKLAYDDVRTVCEDMRARGIRLPANEVLYHIRGAIQRTGTHDEAFKYYLLLRDLAKARMNYVTILTFFIFKRSDSSPFPSARHVLEMIEYGQSQGAEEVDVGRTLVILLRQYCRAVYNQKKPGPDSLRVMEADVGRYVEVIDHYVRHDFQGTPSVHVWGALMNAYGFARNFTAAFDLWDELPEDVRANSTALVSIIMDACGHAKDGERAKRIWRELRSKKHPLSKNNWDAYVECLAKVGREGFQAALKVVLNEMGPKGSEDGTVPAADLHTAAVLLSYAWGYHLITATLLTFRLRLPDLYKQMVAAALEKYDLASEADVGPAQIVLALPKKPSHSPESLTPLTHSEADLVS